MVIFPRVESDGTFTAYADDGTVLQVYDPTSDFGGVAAAASEDSLTLSERRDLHDLVGEQMRNCLDAYGATYPNGLMFRAPHRSQPGHQRVRRHQPLSTHSGSPRMRRTVLGLPDSAEGYARASRIEAIMVGEALATSV
jgi:hypothetical protein